MRRRSVVTGGGAALLLAMVVVGCGSTHRPGPAEAGLDARQPGDADAPVTEGGGEGDGGPPPSDAEVPAETFGWVEVGPHRDDFLGPCARSIVASPGVVVTCAGTVFINELGWLWRPGQHVQEWDAGWAPIATQYCGHGALQPDGRVLWAGGAVARDLTGVGLVLREGDPAAEAATILVDPSSGEAVEGPTGLEPRGGEAGLDLGGGRLLVGGGVRIGERWVDHRYGAHGYEVLASVERFDPGRGRWEPLPPMRVARWGHRYVALEGGRVLAIGGFLSPGWGPDRERASLQATDQVELYEPGRGWRLVASMRRARGLAHVARLPSGRVLVAGGFASNGVDVVDEVEIYDPVADRWEPGEPMPWPVALAAELRLPSGALLLAGGVRGGARGERGRLPTETAVQIYREGRGWSVGPALLDPMFWATAARLPDGRVFVGFGAPAEPFDPYPRAVISTEPVE